MSFSYTGAASGPVGAVRFTIGDTVEATSRISDEDIAYLLERTGGSIPQAARLAVESIIATLSSLCDQSVGSVSKSFSQQRAGWQATLAMLKTRSAYAGGAPRVGGIYRTAARQQNHDRSLSRPQFTARMMQRGPHEQGLVRQIGSASGIDGEG